MIKPSETATYGSSNLDQIKIKMTHLSLNIITIRRPETGSYLHQYMTKIRPLKFSHFKIDSQNPKVENPVRSDPKTGSYSHQWFG